MNKMFDNYFTLFGLVEQYTQSLEVIQQKYYDLQKQFHPDKFIGLSSAEQKLAHDYSAKISDAYKCIKDPFLRAQHLLHCRNQKWDEATANQSLPMEVLLEQMALRETLDALQAKSDPTAQSGWHLFKTDIDNHLSELIEDLKQIDNPSKPLADIYLVMQQIPFYRRLKATIENIETQLSTAPKRAVTETTE